jgi:hypothetical protein
LRRIGSAMATLSAEEKRRIAAAAIKPSAT